MTKEEHNAAAQHLLDAIDRGGNIAENLRVLLADMVGVGNGEKPDLPLLLMSSDKGNFNALMTLFQGWRHLGTPDTLDRWRMREQVAKDGLTVGEGPE